MQVLRGVLPLRLPRGQELADTAPDQEAAGLTPPLPVDGVQAPPVDGTRTMQADVYALRRPVPLLVSHPGLGALGEVDPLPDEDAVPVDARRTPQARQDRIGVMTPKRPLRLLWSGC